MIKYFELKNELYLIEEKEKEKLGDNGNYDELQLCEALSNNVEYQITSTKFAEIEITLYKELGVLNSQAINEEADAITSTYQEM